MKTFKFYLIFFVLLVSISSKANVQNDSIYTNAMKQVLVQLDTATTANTILECKYKFERISQIDPEQWIPLYYIAYCDIRLVYTNPKSDKASSFLDDAKIYLERLNSNKQTNKSEVETLNGFYYTALIVIDPQTNGQKYFNKVISSYQKAMKLNPENPRPICLLVFFNNQLPSFIKLDINVKEEKERATSLFEKEEKNINSPYWGKYYLNLINTTE